MNRIHLRRLRRPPFAGRRRADLGMTTAEYAVGTLGAVAFALVLIGVARSDQVRDAITSVIVSALAGR